MFRQFLCGVVSGRIGSFMLAGFQISILIFGVAMCCIGTFSRDTIGFQIIFHPPGLVGHKKNSLLGVVLTFFVNGFGTVAR